MEQVNPENQCAQLMKHTEYREDALNYMLSMQNSLQEFVGKVRGTKFPKSEMTDSQRADEAIYFWGCAVTEWAELIDARDMFLFVYDSEKNRLEMQYEFIDIWHFMMNVFLYTGIDSSVATLKEIYDEESEENTIEHFWSELNYWVGRYINNLPYQHWKTYKEYVIDDTDLALCFTNIMSLLVNIAKELGIDNERFYDLYVSKNEENINRQSRADYV